MAAHSPATKEGHDQRCWSKKRPCELRSASLVLQIGVLPEVALESLALDNGLASLRQSASADPMSRGPTQPGQTVGGVFPELAGMIDARSARNDLHRRSRPHHENINRGHQAMRQTSRRARNYDWVTLGINARGGTRGSRRSRFFNFDRNSLLAPLLAFEVELRGVVGTFLTADESRAAAVSCIRGGLRVGKTVSQADGSFSASVLERTEGRRSSDAEREPS
jgi:hypothetical protein